MGVSALVLSILPTNNVGTYKIGPPATILIVIVRIVQVRLLLSAASPPSSSLLLSFSLRR